MRRVDGKVVLITGGAGGIGSATARLMVQEGAIVTIGDVAPNGPDVASEIGCDYVSLDVTSEVQWEHAVATIDGKHGGIHVLVNVAGIEGNPGPGGLTSYALDEWRRVFGVNVDGTFLGCRTVLRVMDRLKHGSIINVSSMASFLPSPINCAYGASKAAVQHFSKSVAIWGSRGGRQIRCNSVHPGLIRTRMLLGIVNQLPQSGGDASVMAERMASRMLPLGVLGEPEDVAYQIVYLASDESRHVTGSEFQIDGGWHLRLGASPEPPGRAEAPPPMPRIAVAAGDLR